MSLIKVAHKIWHDYQFSQRNKAVKKHKGIGVCVGVCWGGWGRVGQNLKKRLHKLGGRNPLPTMVSAKM